MQQLMKKLLVLMVAILACSHLSIKADPLFPFFVDLVMDFTEQQAPYTHYKGKTDGGGLAQANAFLKSVVPASYKMQVSDLNWPDGRKVRAFSSSMPGNKMSVIYFITADNGDFSIEYAEGLPSELPSHTAE